MNIRQSKFFMEDMDLESLLLKLEKHKHASSFILNSELKRIKSAHASHKMVNTELTSLENFQILPNDDSLIQLVNAYINDKNVSQSSRRNIIIFLYGKGFINQYYDSIEFPGDIMTKKGVPLRDVIKIDIDQNTQEFTRQFRILEKEFPGFEFNMINRLNLMRSDIERIRTAVRRYTNDPELQMRLEDRIVSIRETYRTNIVGNIIKDFLTTYNVCSPNTYNNSIEESLIEFRSIIPTDKHYAIQTSYFNAITRD